MTNEYTIPLKKLFDKPKRGRAKKAVRAIKEFVKKHKRLNEDQIVVSKEVNEKIWERGMFSIPRKIEVELKEIENRTFVFLQGGKEINEIEKQLKEKKKEDKKGKKEKENKKDSEEEKEKEKKLKEKKEKELNAQKAEFKRKQKE